MTVYDYLKSLKMDFTSMARLFGIITGDTSYENLTFENYITKSRKMEMPKRFMIPQENLLDLMTTINKMVKHESCPNNLRNRFYNQKKTVIRYLLRDGRVSDIYGQGDYYALLVDGKYPFHQPRPFLNHLNFEVKGEQEYKSDGISIPFDKKTYDDFQVLYYIYTGQFRQSREGYPKCPRWAKKAKKEANS